MENQATFPPPGWVINREAARILGVALETLTITAWRLRWGLDCGKCVRMPGGGRCNIYPLAEVERIAAERAAAATPQIPDGFVDKDGACRMFGIHRSVWKNWVRQGKVRIGRIIPSPVGGRQKLYAIADLERLREELFGEDKLYKGADGHYHVPADLLRREEACERFGVSIPTWERWEREGVITCGHRVPGGPKLYRVADVERMLEEYGRWAPPYPDPDRPGVYRVPLSGRDIQRREALIDAESLPLIEGKTCAWSTASGEFGWVSLSAGGPGGVPLRRVILGVVAEGLNVRHANGDPLDCRRANLVAWTVEQRTRNMRKARAIRGRPPTSRFKGVYWETGTQSWRAVIHSQGKKRYLGRFGDEIAAGLAYDEAARLWFGEHARLNFPDGVDAWLEREGFTPGDRAAA
jgi:hypothetical protein